MRLIQVLAPAVGLFAAAKAWGETGAVWTTVVETDYTTYCPVCITSSHMIECITDSSVSLPPLSHGIM